METATGTATGTPAGAGPGRVLDTLVIGGGPMGTHLSLVLSRACGAAVRVLDPHPEPLAEWRRCTEAVGMTHLRSPLVHHLDLDPFSLQRFARDRGYGPEHFQAPYDRPSLRLFHDHVDHLRAAHGLDALRLRGRATRITLGADHATVFTDQGAIEAREVVLALGALDRVDWPAWAARLALRAPSAPVRHLFEPGPALPPLTRGDALLVVGGGVTAAQAALAARAAGAEVTLLTRHPLRVKDFDSDPGWMGPKNMVAFLKERDLGQRRAQIRAARHRGSLPAEVHARLQDALRQGQITLWHGEARGEALPLAGAVSVAGPDGARAAFDQVWLATGVDRARPGGALVDALIAEHGLPCAACGFPVVGPDLRWHRRLRVAGALAELELGPAARNLIGARRAGERFVAAG